MKLAKFLFYIIVCVRWMDITQDGGWITEEELFPPDLVTSCGLFVKENEEFLWLATDQAEDGSYNGVSVWPKGTILKQTAFHFPNAMIDSLDVGSTETPEN